VAHPSMWASVTSLKFLIVVATRYGSTAEGAGWIAERLRLSGAEADVVPAGEAPPPVGCDCVLLGSGIYAHRVLPEMAGYIDRNFDALSAGRVGIFGVSMSPKPVFAGGHAHGGLAHFEELFGRLGGAVIHADMLGGQLAFDALSLEDRSSMEAFCAMLGLDAAGIERRKAPRTLMKKEDYWGFAEELLRKMSQSAR
jgi:menaquinone-dependent protoporphyrinogen oxidase